MDLISGGPISVDVMSHGVSFETDVCQLGMRVDSIATAAVYRS